MKPYFISTAIPYVNASPHIGFALELVQTDAIARYQRLLRNDVLFLSGTDENSLKNVQAAQKAGEETRPFVDRHAKEFEDLKELLGSSHDDFIRTTEERHVKGAQKLWSLFKDGDVYKKPYKGLYCVGCETFYTEDDLDEGGNCVEHNKPPEVVEEENYFFKLTEYQDEIKTLIKNDTIKIVPEIRKNEVLAFIDRGLEDFSISRSHTRAHGWGVPVPGDEEQIMYVWVDALSNYITALDFVGDQKKYDHYWKQDSEDSREVVHVIGKGITRFHAIYWIAMLLSAKQPLPTEMFVHAYITVEGQKMSKSLGNVLNPKDIVAEYPLDAVRYFLLGGLSPYQDSDFSRARLEEFYTAHLVNGVGNLTSRILTMLEKYSDSKVTAVANDVFDTAMFWNTYHELAQRYKFDDLIRQVNELVSVCDERISSEKPWEKAKQGEDITDLLYQLAETLRHIALALLPIIPQSAEAILQQLGIDPTELEALGIEQNWGRLAKDGIIKKEGILFERLES